MGHRILYLSYDGMTDPLGQSQVLPYLCGLSKKGIEITLISFEKTDRFEKAENEIRKITSDTFIEWLPLTYHKSPPVFSTVYDLQKLKSLIRKLEKKKHFDIVHCRGYITAMAGLWMKKKWGTKFLFDMRGFFADERVEGGIWSLSNPVYKTVYRYFKNREKEFFSQADHVISLTHKGKSIISALPYIPSGFSCTVIPCCVDTELFKPEDETSRPTPGAISLCYLGSIGSWYLLDEMLDFFRALLDKKPGASLTFYTYEPERMIRNKLAARNIPDNTINVQPARRNDLPRLLAQHDASLFFIKPVFSKQASSPTKQGELMAMGIPVICNAGVGDTDEIIEKYHSGYLIKEFTTEEYQKAVQVIDEIIRLPRLQIIHGADEYFSLEKGIERYASVYAGLLKSG